MTPAPGHRSQPRLSLDAEEFDKRQRLALYQIVNTLLNLNCDIQKTLRLRPETCQIFMVIAIVAVQRYVRDPGTNAYDGADPLPQELNVTISRRRLSDVTGIPRETVARHVRQLVERGLVVEVGSGKLMTPPGLLSRLGPGGLPQRLASEFTMATQRLVKLGVLRMGPTEEQPRD